MKTERELFLYELSGHGYEFKNKTWIHGMGDVGGMFDDDQLNMVWEMWTASAQRDGYKLVPVEPSAELVNHGHQVFLGHFNEGGQTGGRSLYFAYKAMIGAAE